MNEPSANKRIIKEGKRNPRNPRNKKPIWLSQQCRSGVEKWIIIDWFERAINQSKRQSKPNRSRSNQRKNAQPRINQSAIKSTWRWAGISRAWIIISKKMYANEMSGPVRGRVDRPEGRRARPAGWRRLRPQRPGNWASWRIARWSVGLPRRRSLRRRHDPRAGGRCCNDPGANLSPVNTTPSFISFQFSLLLSK